MDRPRIREGGLDVRAGGLDGLDVKTRNLVEAIDGRAKALKMLSLAASCNGGQRAPMKGACEGDEPIAFRRAVRKMIAACRLDGAFESLSA